MSINQRQNVSNQHLVKVWDYTLLKEKRDRKKEVLYLKSQGIEAGDKELMEERDGLYFLFFWRLPATAGSSRVEAFGQSGRGSIGKPNIASMFGRSPRF